MRRIKGLLGQDIISLADGHRLGTVKDVVLDESHEHIAALLVQDAGLLSAARAIPADAIHSFGRDAIVVEADDAVVDPAMDPTIDVTPGDSLEGMRVFSDAGTQVGTIADIYFEEDECRIVGFEVSAGMVGDLAQGTRFLPVEQIDRVAGEIVYVHPETAESLEATLDPSGAVGALDDIRSRVSEAAGEVGDKVSSAVAQAPGAEDETGGDLAGRRSGAEVSDQEGRILIANGQRISEDHVARARDAGKLDELRAAAEAGSAAERARVIGGAVEQITDTAGSVWDRFLHKLGTMTDEAGQRMSEQQTKARLATINDAVGRPVTKVILDRDDEVVLNLGDIITHESIQRAHEAGILDSLLASVYKGEVDFDRDEMKAPVEATSTVAKAGGGAAIVDELQEAVDTTESQRREAAEQQRREAEEARERRESERQERVRLRDEAAQRADAGEPEPEAAEPAEPEPAEPEYPEPETVGSQGASRG
jgi:uncharacterized protein YrrD